SCSPLCPRGAGSVEADHFLRQLVLDRGQRLLRGEIAPADAAITKRGGQPPPEETRGDGVESVIAIIGFAELPVQLPFYSSADVFQAVVQSRCHRLDDYNHAGADITAAIDRREEKDVADSGARRDYAMLHREFGERLHVLRRRERPRRAPIVGVEVRPET